MEARAHFEALDSSGWSPLTHAASSGGELVQILLHIRAQVEVIDNENRTPLCYAAANGNTEIMLQLLDAKASPEIVDEIGWGEIGWTPLCQRP